MTFPTSITTKVVIGSVLSATVNRHSLKGFESLNKIVEVGIYPEVWNQTSNTLMD